MIATSSKKQRFKKRGNAVIRNAVAIGLAILVCACTTITESAQKTISPASANGSRWTISAKAETGTLYDDVTLYVDGTAVATGRLGPSESEHHGVRIAGDYQHHIVLGICSRSDDHSVTYTCDVSVDGAPADTLSW